MFGPNTTTNLTRRALTLVELLITVTILGILALAALPSVRNAMVRAKGSAAKANQRVLATALQAYHVDHNSYPPTVSRPPQDLFGILASEQLDSLTTPVAYLAGGESYHDPFGVIMPAATTSARNDLPVPAIPNPRQSLLYYHYPTFAERTRNTRLDSPGTAIISFGPDREDSFGAFSMFPAAMPPLARLYGINSAWDTVYDPTNGTISRGDMPRFVGVSGGNTEMGAVLLRP